MPNYIRQDSAETRESKIGMTRYRNLDEVKTRVGQTPEDNTVFNVFVNDGDAESAFGVLHGTHKKGRDVPIGTVTIGKSNIAENQFEITSNGTNDVSPARSHPWDEYRNRNRFSQYGHHDGEFLLFNAHTELFQICHLENGKPKCNTSFLDEPPPYVFLEENKSEKIIRAVKKSYNTVKNSFDRVGSLLGYGASGLVDPDNAQTSSGGKSKRRRKIKKTRRRKRTRRNKRN